MKTDVCLNSVVAYGVGSGPECGAIELIYKYLLHEFEQDIYSRISINQIGDDLNEFVMKESGKKIHVNIRYFIHENFETRSIDEKNRIRLDVLHTALLRIANYDKKLDINKLEAIRKKILENNFLFEFIYKVYINKKKPNLLCTITVQPLINEFVFNAIVDDNKIVKCKKIIYNGISNDFYMDKFFCYGKWDDENKITISGKEKIVEIRIIVDECKVEYINLTPYYKPPYFELMKAGISKDEKERSRKDWQHSLPPHIAAAIRESEN